MQTGCDAVTLGISPTSPATVYLSGYPNFFGKNVGATPTGQGLYASTDGWATWTLSRLERTPRQRRRRRQEQLLQSRRRRAGRKDPVPRDTQARRDRPDRRDVLRREQARTRHVQSRRRARAPRTSSAQPARPTSRGSRASGARSAPSEEIKDRPQSEGRTRLDGGTDILDIPLTGTLIGAYTAEPPKTDLAISITFDPPTFLTMLHGRTANVTITNNGPSDVSFVAYELEAVFPGAGAAEAMRFAVPQNPSYQMLGCSFPVLVAGSGNVFKTSCFDSFPDGLPAKKSATVSYSISWLGPLASPRAVHFRSQHYSDLRCRRHRSFEQLGAANVRDAQEPCARTPIRDDQPVFPVGLHGNRPGSYDHLCLVR